jgi:F-type H+-transporting ATPase subunit b
VELNLTTFLLEIVNFLVLVWILKRFLYKPVLAVIARRKAGIDQTLAEADDKLQQAAKLRQQYEGRVADWEQERREAREKLAHEIEAEREHRLAELQALLADEREKAEVADARCRADTTRRLEESALQQGGRFAARLLSLGAGAQTQTRLLELLLADLRGLSEEQRTRLRSAAGEAPGAIDVVSAFPLSPEQLEHLRQALTSAIGLELPLHPGQDEQLIAGIQITIGAWVLGANLRDELQGFADLAHEA